MNSENFILTKSKETAEALVKEGFNLISRAEGMWFFLNDNKLTFSQNENVTYTNTLFI